MGASDFAARERFLKWAEDPLSILQRGPSRHGCGGPPVLVLIHLWMVKSRSVPRPFRHVPREGGGNQPEWRSELVDERRLLVKLATTTVPVAANLR